jgi:hypothetical protein
VLALVRGDEERSWARAEPPDVAATRRLDPKLAHPCASLAAAASALATPQNRTCISQLVAHTARHPLPLFALTLTLIPC